MDVCIKCGKKKHLHSSDTNWKVHVRSNMVYISYTYTQYHVKCMEKILRDDITVLKVLEEWARGIEAVETWVSVRAEQHTAAVCTGCNCWGTEPSQSNISRDSTHNNNHLNVTSEVSTCSHCDVPQSPKASFFSIHSPPSAESFLPQHYQHSSLDWSGNKLEHAD